MFLIIINRKTFNFQQSTIIMSTLAQQFLIMQEILDKPGKIYYAEGEREMVENFFDFFKDFKFLEKYKNLLNLALKISAEAQMIRALNRETQPKINEKVKTIFRKLVLKFRIKGYDPFKEINEENLDLDNEKYKTSSI